MAERPMEKMDRRLWMQFGLPPEAFLPPVFGLVFTALLKSSPVAAVVHPPSPPDAAGSDDDAGAEEEAVGLAQSGSPYCPLIC
mmetsp:Transcript_4661/g.5920  ORF Transcript_4661/g.5920 Transcript_4661/m.5920 type:complete len:83 (-) Transcript_4661:17-265(-)